MTIFQKGESRQYLKPKKTFKTLLLKLFGRKTLTQVRSVYWAHQLKRGRFYEREIDLLPNFVNKGDICIDIGANLGQYTFPLSKLVGNEGRIFSFEPVTHAFDGLKNVVKKLNLQNVRVLKFALGEKSGESEFILKFGGSYLKDKKRFKQKTEKVKVTTLDKMSKVYPQLNKVKFIKCDVEGTELMVFKGGKKLLTEVCPLILCEIEENQTRKYNYDPKEIFNFLQELNYESFVFKSEKLKATTGTYPLAINYIFIPQNLINRYRELYEDT